MSVALYPGLSIILVNDDENILLIKSGLNSIISLAGRENVSEQQGENPFSVWLSFFSLFTDNLLLFFQSQWWTKNKTNKMEQNVLLVICIWILWFHLARPLLTSQIGADCKCSLNSKHVVLFY